MLYLILSLVKNFFKIEKMNIQKVYYYILFSMSIQSLQYREYITISNIYIKYNVLFLSVKRVLYTTSVIGPRKS